MRGFPIWIGRCFRASYAWSSVGDRPYQQPCIEAKNIAICIPSDPNGIEEEGMMRIFQAIAGTAVTLVLTSMVAQAQLLTVVEVNAPAVNCVFNPGCTII